MSVALVVVVGRRHRARDLPWVLGRVPAGWERIVVADDRAPEGSAALAGALGAAVAPTLAAAVAGTDAPTIAWVPLDRSVDPRDLRPLAAAVAAGDADVVLAARERPTLVDRVRRRPSAKAGVAGRGYAEGPAKAPRVTAAVVRTPTEP